MTPKVLVISNECFSKSSSNGRTLGNFFIGWPKDNLAQFFLTGKPDCEYCENYYYVSDRQALNALLRKNNTGGVVQEDELVIKQRDCKLSDKKVKRNALTMLGRNYIWKLSPWKSKGYWDWVKRFNPDVVLLQAGDCAFMYDLAVQTSRKTDSKLIIYNSEGCYFKDFDYFQASEYAETVFTGSEVKCEPKEKENSVFTTVYCGNLGLKRHESLIDIAKQLQAISSDLYVDLYGKTNDPEVINALNNCKGIRFHGLILYEEDKRILRNADLLLYVESFDSFYQEDIKFGFSTKIADSLSSGNCLLLYAPEHFACYKYLENNNAAYTASNKDQLKLILSELVNTLEARTKYQTNALELARKNHDILKNNKKFQSILCDAVK